MSRVLNRTSPAESLSSVYDISIAKTDMSKSQIIPVFNIFNRKSNEVMRFANMKIYTTIRATMFRSYFDYDIQKSINELVDFPLVQCS